MDHWIRWLYMRETGFTGPRNKEVLLVRTERLTEILVLLTNVQLRAGLSYERAAGTKRSIGFRPDDYAS